MAERTNIPPPPPGFTMGPQGSIPPPPPGFTMMPQPGVAPPPAPPAPPAPPGPELPPEVLAAGPQGIDSVDTKPPPMTGSWFENLLDSTTEGITSGWGAELTAHEAAFLGRTPDGDWFNYDKTYDERYADALAAEQVQNVGFREAHPGAAITAEVGGAIASPINKLMKGGTLAKNVLAGMGQGALYGAGTSEEGGRLKGAAEGTLLGAGTSLGVGYAGRRLKKVMNAPTVQQLKTKAQEAYRAAEAVGVKMSKASTDALSAKLTAVVENAGTTPDLTKKAHAALAGVQRHLAKGDMTIAKMDLANRILKSVFNDVSPQAKDDRRVAGLLVDTMDDYIGNLKVQDLAQWAGHNIKSGVVAAKEATSNIKTGQKLWAKMRKSEILEEAMVRAKDRSPLYRQAGIENAIRAEYRRILARPHLMRGFNKTEQKYIRKVAKGSVPANVMRQVGKYSPTSVIGGGIGGGLGYYMGGPAGAAAVATAGLLGKGGSTLATKAAARRAEDVVRSGRAFRSLLPEEEMALGVLRAGGLSAASSEQTKARR